LAWPNSLSAGPDSPALSCPQNRGHSNQSGERDLRGPLAKQGPRYLRWALVEAATHACTAPAYRDRYQQTKARIGKQRGAKVAQVDLARRLAEAIWHMLSRGEAFAPKGATDPLAA
jgi:transposase